jgi:hypothetical protein
MLMSRQMNLKNVPYTQKQTGRRSDEHSWTSFLDHHGGAIEDMCSKPRRPPPRSRPLDASSLAYVFTTARSVYLDSAGDAASWRELRPEEAGLG